MNAPKGTQFVAEGKHHMSKWGDKPIDTYAYGDDQMNAISRGSIALNASNDTKFVADVALHISNWGDIPIDTCTYGGDQINTSSGEGQRDSTTYSYRDDKLSTYSCDCEAPQRSE